MSDHPLQAVLAELLKFAQATRVAVEQLTAGHLTVVDRLTKLDAGQTRLEEGQTRTRVDLMARMDRLQNTLTERKDDADTLLEIMALNQRLAEQAGSVAQSAFEVGGLNSSLYLQMAKRLARLEDQVRDLRERGAG